MPAESLKHKAPAEQTTAIAVVTNKETQLPISIHQIIFAVGLAARRARYNEVAIQKGQIELPKLNKVKKSEATNKMDSRDGCGAQCGYHGTYCSIGPHDDGTHYCPSGGGHTF